MQENQYLAEEEAIILSLETLNMLTSNMLLEESTHQMLLLIEKVTGKNRNNHKFKLYTSNDLQAMSEDDIILTSCFRTKVPQQGAIYVSRNCSTPLPVIKINTHLNLLWKDGKVPPKFHLVNLNMEIRNFDSDIT